MNKNKISVTVIRISMLFSLSLLMAVPFAVFHTGETHVFKDWIRLLKSPCPLVTDFFMLGSLPAAFFNAGICGLFCSLVMMFMKEDCKQSFLSSYFLVIAHCFYGLNFLSMMFTVFGLLIYCVIRKKKFSHGFDIVMLSTAFGPFYSELLWKYKFYLEFHPFGLEINLFAVIAALALSLFLGFVIPALLEGAKKLHRGFNLYNAGLAFGLLGLLVYSFLFKTLGNSKPQIPLSFNSVYVENFSSYSLFCNVFFISVFGVCLLVGFILNGKRFNGYSQLLNDNGKGSDFLASYGTALTMINIGLYGLFIVLYFNSINVLTEGAGWTGATCGVTLAAITFSASGQTPRNVCPIIMGFVLLSLGVEGIGLISGRPITWTLSSQEYINGLAFATGLCPFTGYFGVFAGILAGIIDAVICTATVQLHGGLMLYNGGLTAGLTAMILTPILIYYGKKKHLP